MGAKDYIADRRSIRYAADGRRIVDGGWAILEWDGARQIYIEPQMLYPTKRAAAAELRDQRERSRAAAALGRLGGLKGGKAGGEAKVRGDADHYAALGRLRGIYSVTWREPEGRTEPLPALPGRTTLGQVVRLCREYEIAARLTDEQGAARGRVESDGTYSLQ